MQYILINLYLRYIHPRYSGDMVSTETLLQNYIIGVWIDTYVFYKSVLQKMTWIANLVIVFCDS